MKRVIWIVFIAAVLLMAGCRDSSEMELNSEESKILGMSRDQAIRYLEKQGYTSVQEVYEYSYRTKAGRVTDWRDYGNILYLSKGKPPGDMPLAIRVEDGKVYWTDPEWDPQRPARILYECLFELTNKAASDLFGSTGTIIKAEGTETDNREWLIWMYGLTYAAHEYSQFEDSIFQCTINGNEGITFFDKNTFCLTACNGMIYGKKNGIGLVRRDPEGGKTDILLEDIVEFRIVDDHILYLVKDDGFHVRTADLDGKNPVDIMVLDTTADIVWLVGAIGDWVYYYTPDVDDKPRQMYRTDGEQTEFLTEIGWPRLEGEELFRDYDPVIIGEWIVFYGNEDPDGLWRIRGDGTDKEPIAVIRDVLWTTID